MSSVERLGLCEGPKANVVRTFSTLLTVSLRGPSSKLVIPAASASAAAPARAASVTLNAATMVQVVSVLTAFAHSSATLSGTLLTSAVPAVLASWYAFDLGSGRPTLAFVFRCILSHWLH